MQQHSKFKFNINLFINKILFRIHKVVLASGSKYMLEVFTQMNKEIFKEVEIPIIDIPLPVKTSLNSAGVCQDECVFKILKYLYNN